MARPVKPPRMNYEIDSNGCWISTHSKDKDGYGRAWDYRIYKNKPAHRLNYEIHHGVELDKDTVVDHLCKVKSCVNPEHLRAISWAENTRAGDTAKLNRGYAIRIKLLKLNGLTDKAIARMFDVNQSQISRVVNNRTWKRG